MQVIEHSATRLVLRERPWLVWGVGALLAASGLYVAVFASEPLFGGVFTLGGLVAILFAGQTVTCTFDRAAGELTRERRGLLGSRQLRHPLGAVGAVHVRRSSGRGRSYRVELALSSGDSVPLTPLYGSGQQDKEMTAALVRDFLGLPAAVAAGPPGLRDLVGMLRAAPSGDAPPRRAP
jgi:hypothetical protein